MSNYGRRLQDWQRDGIKADLERGLLTMKEIARKRGCSMGAVAHIKHPERAKKYRTGSTKTGPVVRHPVVVCAMPWVTKDMLTGARAPIAKVRS